MLCLAAAGCAALGTNGETERRVVIDRIVASSVKVIVQQGDRRVSSGSGVVIASRLEGPGAEPVSYVLTAQHILAGKEEGAIFVRFTGVNVAKGKLAATLVRHGEAEGLDLALLRVPGISATEAVFPDTDEVRLGEEILVVGFPWGKRLGLFGGIVSQVPVDGKEGGAPDEGTEQTLVVDAAPAKGVSGGGVFREATGSLLGIVEGYQTASIAIEGRPNTYSVKVPMPGETFVVPIARIRRFLEAAGLGGATPQPVEGEERSK